jgi:aspartate kinase
VVVVAGFQGITAAGEVTTLGRGGSDTTAMALGEALAAERVEIYTDVEGVHSADPRVVPGARAIAEVTYEESAELARKGAEILHPHAAQRARASGLPVVIRSLDDHASVTWLVADEGRWSADGAPAPRTTAVTSTSEIAQVTVSGASFSKDPGLLEKIFRGIAQQGISLDMMSIFPDRASFTLPRERAPEAAGQVTQSGLSVVVNDRCAKITLVGGDDRCAKITLVGGGIHGIPGIMHLVVRALAERGIAILQSVDSNMIISVLVERDRELDAVRALHAEFFE